MKPGPNDKKLAILITGDEFLELQRFTVDMAEAFGLGENVEAVESLRRSVRVTWFAAHRLPARVRFYSLAAYAGPPDVSALLMPFWGILARTDPANDGLVVASDAIIPGSTLLGYRCTIHVKYVMDGERRVCDAESCETAQCSVLSFACEAAISLNTFNEPVRMIAAERSSHLSRL